MAYLGNDLQVAYQSYQIIDDISSSFNGVLTTFPLQVGGVTPVPFPINPQQCLISVNGVIQEPDPSGTSGFNLVGSNIEFSSAPTGGHAFFGVILAGADYVNVGVNYPSGSESAPSITFDADLDTGIYNPAANELGLTTNGTNRLNVGASGQINILTGGSAGSPSLVFNTDVNSGLYSPGADQVALSTNGTGRLFIDSSGNVGIGTSSPSQLLELNSTNASGGVGLNITNQGDGGATTTPYAFINARLNAVRNGGEIRFGREANYGSAANADSYMAFYTAADDVNNEHLRITSDGKVGIGTTSPGVTLHLGNDSTFRINNPDGTRTLDLFNDANNAEIKASVDPIRINAFHSTGYVRFDTNNTERARIDSSGRLLVGTSTGTAPLTVAGTNIEVTNTNGAYINNSQTTSVSTSATTIIGDAGFQGRLWVINGAEGGNRFCDLVMASTAAAPVVVQSYTAFGTPTARTYTRSGTAVQLAMASGTYDVRCIGFGA